MTGRESGGIDLPDLILERRETMKAYAGSWLSRRKLILVAVGLPALVAAWWAFRPEKLWINEKASEPAPFASSTDPQPLYTGRLEGKVHQTNGRATIYETSDGKQYLRLTDFTTSNGPDVHVVLAQGDDKSLTQEIVQGQFDRIELGSLKGNQGDQNYDLPAPVDLSRYNAVTIYCERFHAVFGVARLERF
jgi:electron transfer DM13